MKKNEEKYCQVKKNVYIRIHNKATTAIKLVWNTTLQEYYNDEYKIT